MPCGELGLRRSLPRRVVSSNCYIQSSAADFSPQRCNGFTGERGAILCNGAQFPLVHISVNPPQPRTFFLAFYVCHAPRIIIDTRRFVGFCFSCGFIVERKVPVLESAKCRQLAKMYGPPPDCKRFEVDE